MKDNWTYDRAIGFVIGVMCMICIFSSLATFSPIPAFFALLFMAVGIYALRCN